MRTSIPRVMVPLDMADAMLTSCTIAEPASGETAWVSAASYTAGDYVIRTTTHRVYRAITTHTGVTTLPENDATNWYDVGPTNRWSPFDAYVSTACSDVTSVSYVIEPGYINAIALYGLVGATLDVTYKDQSGGTTLYANSFDLTGPYYDEWDYCFGPHRTIDRMLVDSLTPYPDAELTLTLAAGTGNPVAIGMLAFGDMRPLILGDWGGTTYGAEIEPKTYSYIDVADDGTTTIRRRGSATDMTIDVVLPAEDADYAVATIQEVLDQPAAWSATTASNYLSYNIFGLASGRRRAESHVHDTFQITVKGMI